MRARNHPLAAGSRHKDITALNNIIDGEDIDGPGSIQSINPATEEVCARISAGIEADATRRIGKALRLDLNGRKR